MSVVRRRLPPTRLVHRTLGARHIAEPGIPPWDSPARSTVRSVLLHPRSALGVPGHEAPDEAGELARDRDGRDLRRLAALDHPPVPACRRCCAAIA